VGILLAGNMVVAFSVAGARGHASCCSRPHEAREINHDHDDHEQRRQVPRYDDI
jgi:hypothetical protein